MNFQNNLSSLSDLLNSPNNRNELIDKNKRAYNYNENNTNHMSTRIQPQLKKVKVNLSSKIIKKKQYKYSTINQFQYQRMGNNGVTEMTNSNQKNNLTNNSLIYYLNKIRKDNLQIMKLFKDRIYILENYPNNVDIIQLSKNLLHEIESMKTHFENLLFNNQKNILSQNKINNIPIRSTNQSIVINNEQPSNRFTQPNKKLNHNRNYQKQPISIQNQNNQQIVNGNNNNNILKKSKINDQKYYQQNFNWSKIIHKVKNQVFGIKAFRTNQEAIINATISKKDIFVLMPTGGGKSLTYMIPTLVEKGITIVISPLISLIMDQVLTLENLNIIVAAFTSDLKKNKQENIYKELSKDNCQIQLLYCTPEKLRKCKRFSMLLRKLYLGNHILRFVIDEVHCVSQWGHDFRPDYYELSQLKKKFPKVPILALTSTATERVKKDIIHILGIEGCKIFNQSLNRPNLIYEVKKKNKNQICKDIYNFIQENYANQSGIIYCFSRDESERLTQMLLKHGLSCCYYHAGLDPQLRTLIQKKWQNNQIQVIIATVAFGMGVNKPDIRFVIHHTFPKSLENLCQESGRAGRDGKKSHCIIYFSLQDRTRMEKFLNDEIESETINKEYIQMISEVVDYCLNTNICRRKILLSYFKENFNPINCNKCCDVCNSKQKIKYKLTDLTEDAKKIVQIFHQIEEETLNKLVGILRGSNSKMIREKGYNTITLKEFGCLKTKLTVQETIHLISKLDKIGVIQHKTIQMENKYQTLITLYSNGPQAEELINNKIKVFLKIKKTKKKKK
ncbi:atp-dependent DNA helicase q-like 4a [Anaeramoeba flamelloides]|uniref:ATP-dependent DNA helicase n=1 Tax=Anaeramoeba flamelloides TaxID=1746091 RepID=A0ABQ8XC41_9EUKA|nr:atp-dependent DNA helicase q-like 4a [Anaeramoeba flamelloides]